MQHTIRIPMFVMGAAVAVLGASAPAAAQAPDTLRACYVKGSGSVYRISAQDAPASCTKATHIPFSWLGGGSGSGGQTIVPSGAAAGDLGGSYPAPTVVGLQGRNVFGGAPADGQFLGWNGSLNRWEPRTAPAGGGAGATAHGQLSGLGADDHAQYLLTDGVRHSVNGFAVTGTLNQGSIPVSGAGERLMWYPGKAAFRAGSVAANQWDDAQIGAYSTAFGRSTRATGMHATAMGYFTTAADHFATAMGRNTEALAPASTAMGGSTRATQDYATAMGTNTMASGIASTALGINTVARGDASVAMGSYSDAAGSHSTAMGFDTKATGNSATAMGRSTTASGLRATAMGWQSTASGENSTALGRLTTASNNSATAMGSETTASGIASTAMGYSTTASGNNATAMGSQTLATGNNSTAMGHRAFTNGMTGAFVYGDASSSNTVAAQVNNHFVVRAQRFWFGNNNNVTVSSGRFIETHTGAYLSTGGTWTNSSDVNRKHQFRAVDSDDVLDRVASLPISSWSYRDDEPAVRHIGPTAQDFRAAFGLGADDRAIATVDADGISLAAIQALAKRSRDQAAQLATIKRENASLRALLTQLEQRLAALEVRHEPTSR